LTSLGWLPPSMQTVARVKWPGVIGGCRIGSMCYLGLQESLVLLGKLMEVAVQD
jgi:hypothetical protein